MSWPTPQDYNEAIQMPLGCFEDAELRIGHPELSALGLPRPITGAFASVYKIHAHNRDWAVRCFLRDVQDQHSRYQAISKYLPHNGTAYTPGFQYVERGIKVSGTWYPILKMEWLEGKSLDQFVNEYVSNQTVMHSLAEHFKQLVLALNRNGLAHGDLQHGNILVVPSGLKLVDYDGMYVPELKGAFSTELGHPNYQHPIRTAEHFGPYLDNFSAWVIYCSLLCLSIDHSLWQQLSGGDESLLFHQHDFANPYRSYTFSSLEHHVSPQIQTMSKIIRTLLSFGPDSVPQIDQPVTPLSDLPTLPEPSALLTTRTTTGHWSSEQSPERLRSAWPSQDYFEQAVKTPSACFKDRELRRGHNTFEFVASDHGSVFHIAGVQRHLAVKCYLRDQPDREIRYYELKRTLTGPAETYFIEFEYQREGIHDNNGRWFPILKMDWLPGPTLDTFILQRLAAGDKAAPDALLYKFRAMMRTLYQSGIAHSDISAKNIIVTKAGLKLVDYDNVYSPSLLNYQSSEFGEPLYQHPARSLRHFGPYLDNYPAWVIDNTLSFLSSYPDTFHWGWEYIVQLVRDDQLLHHNKITNHSVEPVVSFYVNAETHRRAQLMHYLMQFPLEQIPPIIDDFGSNLLKREALMQSINSVLGRHTEQH